MFVGISLEVGCRSLELLLKVAVLPASALLPPFALVKLTDHDIDGIALIEHGAIINTAGVVTIVSAIEHRPISPRNGAIVAGGESRYAAIVPAPNGDGAIAVSPTSSDEAPSTIAATNGDPAERD